MKDVNKEVIKYYIKLAQKLSKKKRIYFERDKDTVYFSDGCFVCAFSVERKEEFCALCSAFNLPWAGDYMAEFCDGNLFDNKMYIKDLVDESTKKPGKCLMFTGVSTYERNTKMNIDVFSDNKTVFFYNSMYTKPLKDNDLYLYKANNNGWTWAVYNVLDVCFLVFPCVSADSLVKVAKLMNK